ncbi:Phospholipid-binding Copine Family Protein [Giardia duodenalis]|uniref:Phospholipid-binding Copine Family Protein n=1 Tax=Giardia intestinalis TaxID=5741 RepID=V6U3J0_GIAIN|nr:Phospholipid-binding Copine Family Protein [Giardia intestinalis]
MILNLGMGKVKLATNINTRIRNYYKTYDELEAALRLAGVESMQMVVGIDFSKSNEWTGEKTYQRGLHDSKCGETPYAKALRIMSSIVSRFDDDDIYPVYRFGCINTKNKSVLPLLYPEQDDPHFQGFDAVKEAYEHIAPQIEMSGPTTFAPMIRQAIEISKETGNQYMILVLLTDGDVSNLIEDTKALRDASNYPLSIVTVGLGDGPFKKMRTFDDHVRGRKFDNFQFVDFTKMEAKAKKCESPDLMLATAMMQEIPSQYAFIKRLGYLN